MESKHNFLYSNHDEDSEIANTLYCFNPHIICNKVSAMKLFKNTNYVPDDIYQILTRIA